jgi:hypothetical protein
MRNKLTVHFAHPSISSPLVRLANRGGIFFIGLEFYLFSYFLLFSINITSIYRKNPLSIPGVKSVDYEILD